MDSNCAISFRVHIARKRIPAPSQGTFLPFFLVRLQPLTNLALKLAKASGECRPLSKLARLTLSWLACRCMIPFDATGGACATAGEGTALLCRLMSLLPLRKGLLLPAPPVELNTDTLEIGMVALLLAGVAALLAKGPWFGFCGDVAKNEVEAFVSPASVALSGMLGIGWGAR